MKNKLLVLLLLFGLISYIYYAYTRSYLTVLMMAFCALGLLIYNSWSSKYNRPILKKFDMWILILLTVCAPLLYLVLINENKVITYLEKNDSMARNVVFAAFFVAGAIALIAALIYTKRNQNK